MDEKSIEQLAAEANARYYAMTSEEKVAHDKTQRESWAKGEAGIGDDRQEAVEREAYRNRQVVSSRLDSNGKTVVFNSDGTVTRDGVTLQEPFPAGIRRNMDGSYETVMSDGTFRKGDWLQTFTGKRFFPLDPREEDVCIEDIAHSLAHQCRYGGHVKRFYSVAEHCILLSERVYPDHAFAALMHDCAEAYLVDIPRPIKIALPQYKLIEQEVEKVIAKKFNVTYPWPDEVMICDTRMLNDEGTQLMGPPNDWAKYGESLGVQTFNVAPPAAEESFLRRFHELYKEA